MFFSFLSPWLVLLQISTLAGQFPRVDGRVIGTGSRREETPDIKRSVAGSLRVTENSQICETTPAVYSASGYADLDANSHLWFWFFESRTNKAASPVTLWLNGGPGSSSMIGVFQENGPCRIRNDSSGVDINPTSWNQLSNMLYLDQPVGVGFSYGNTTVSSSQEAAKALWQFLQIFFADSKFSKYASREFVIWTESYGGHYGPVTAAYFLDQNAAIASGSIQGIPINLQVLGIGNGWIDPITQYPAYITYSQTNPYYPLVSQNVTHSVNQTYYSSGGCRDLILSCNATLQNTICSQAQSVCQQDIVPPLIGDYDPYYVLSKNPDPYPANFTNYITNSSLMSAIGAQSNWTIGNPNVYINFANTGDMSKSSIADLEKVISAGIRTALYAGDADYLCNYMGVEAMIDRLNTTVSSLYSRQVWTTWTVSGKIAGQYKNAGNFSYVRFYGSGHEVPAYSVADLPTGWPAFTMFDQAIAAAPIYPN